MAILTSKLCFKKLLVLLASLLLGFIGYSYGIGLIVGQFKCEVAYL